MKPQMPALLIDHLVRNYPTAKRQTLKRMIDAGRVTVNGAPARRLKQPIGPGDRIEVKSIGKLAAKAASRGEASQHAALRIIFEDRDLLVVDKPAGLLTSTNVREKRPTLLAAVRDYLAQSDPTARVGLIHRLDRDASGLLVFSKNDPAYTSLKAQFFHHTVDRIYAAVVRGAPALERGTIESNLVELPDGRVRPNRQIGHGQAARTDYVVLRTVEKHSLLRVTLHTGRKHQIRAHLRQLGTPIVGDKLYAQDETDGPLLLAAVRLCFEHPRSGKRVEFEVDLPVEMRKAMREVDGRPRSLTHQ